MYPDLSTYVAARIGEFERIDPDRRERLEAFAGIIAAGVSAGRPVRLTFICTHNSRRSHMAEAWAAVGAAHFAVPGVQTYSGGTEATAFNPRAVEALRRAGFRIERSGGDLNPIYLLRHSDDAPPGAHFSKVFDQAPNPAEGFCAVLVCSQADASCPHVAGADERIAIPYDDPKAFDATPREAQMYDERCAQIAREVLYAFSRVGR